MIQCPQCKGMDDPSGPGDPCKCGHSWTADELVQRGFDRENFGEDK